MIKTVSVTVVIPCYRCINTIERALKSVVVQTARPAEIFLIDDASDDGTLDKLYEMQACYGRDWINVIALKKNSGPSPARNAGWENSTQNYIAFLDADDAWHPRKLEIQYEWMTAHPDVALTGHPCEWVKKKGSNYQLPTVYNVHQIKKNNLLLSNLFPTRSVMLKRSIPYRFDPQKRHSEDYLLWCQIVLSGYQAYRLEVPLAYLYKAPYGVSGLSCDLWKMEKGELDVYRVLINEGFIDKINFWVLSCFSAVKFLRRLFLTKISELVL